MRKVRIGLTVVLALGLIVGLSFFLIGILRPKSAGIFIETIPSAQVMIDGEQVGRTPYRENKLEPGEVVVKLVPESFTIPLAPYETKINLEPGVETVVRREFGETQELSSGEVISFEKNSGDMTSLAIISVPDSAQVVIDGTIREFTPYKTSNIAPGEHSLQVSIDGYVERSFKVRTHEGYKLTAIVELARSMQEEAVPEPSPTPVNENDTIKIIETSTGFLRVRSEPSTLGEEVGQVEPGEIYEVLDTDEDTGWYKIEFESEDGTSQSGWISNQYAEVVEEGSGETASPSATVTTSEN